MATHQGCSNFQVRLKTIEAMLKAENESVAQDKNAKPLSLDIAGRSPIRRRPPPGALPLSPANSPSPSRNLPLPIGINYNASGSGMGGSFSSLPKQSPSPAGSGAPSSISPASSSSSLSSTSSLNHPPSSSNDPSPGGADWTPSRVRPLPGHGEMPAPLNGSYPHHCSYLPPHHPAPSRHRHGHHSSSSRHRVQDTEEKLDEIMNQTGILTFPNQQRKYNAELNDLQLIGDLGHGTCGHVVKMVHKQSAQVMAVKQMRRSGNQDENKRIIMDLDVVLRSRNMYIVHCYGCFITNSDVWICMEMMATCMDKLSKRLPCGIPERILGKLTVSTVRALHYLKENHNVIHRDVKPSNILLDERTGVFKLCDFGISGRLVDSKAKTRSAGCAAYMSPERIDPPDPHKPDYDIRADVWSLGISLVELATGSFPYRGANSDFEVLTKVLHEDPPLISPSRDFSYEFCALVKDCLTKDYHRRPKYKKLIEHAFIKYFEQVEVDVAAWYRSLPPPTSPH